MSEIIVLNEKDNVVDAEVVDAKEDKEKRA